jgi:hypothetical protein
MKKTRRNQITGWWSSWRDDDENELEEKMRRSCNEHIKSSMKHSLLYFTKITTEIPVPLYHLSNCWSSSHVFLFPLHAICTKVFPLLIFDCFSCEEREREREREKRRSPFTKHDFDQMKQVFNLWVLSSSRYLVVRKSHFFLQIRLSKTGIRFFLPFIGRNTKKQRFHGRLRRQRRDCISNCFCVAQETLMLQWHVMQEEGMRVYEHERWTSVSMLHSCCSHSFIHFVCWCFSVDAKRLETHIIWIVTSPAQEITHSSPQETEEKEAGLDIAFQSQKLRQTHSSSLCESFRGYRD